MGEKGSLMSDNFTLASQKRGIVTIQGDIEDLQLTLIYRHHLSKPSNLEESGVPDALGAYILCEQTPDEEGRWRCYVGKSAEGGLPSRLQTHMSTPKSQISGWAAAVLLHKNDGTRLSQDAASALEHFLWNLLRDKNGVKLVNEKPPTGNPQLPIYETDKMRHACQVAVAFLPMIGVNVSAAAKTRNNVKAAKAVVDEKAPSEQASSIVQKQTYNPEKISDLIQAGLLRVGDVLEPAGAKYQGLAKSVIYDADGTIKIIELHGQSRSDEDLLYSTASKATGPVVAPANNANGWVFWKVQRTGKTLAETREQYKTARG